MATMPEYWKRYASVNALVRGECCGFRPVNDHTTYCCNYGEACYLTEGGRDFRCPHFEAALLPVAPAQVAGEYSNRFSRLPTRAKRRPVAASRTTVLSETTSEPIPKRRGRARARRRKKQATN